MTPSGKTQPARFRLCLLLLSLPLLSCQAIDRGPYEMDPRHLSPVTLEGALEDARLLLENARFGEAEGQFPPHAKAKLESAIARAKSAHGNPVKRAHALYDALSSFEASVVSRYDALIDPHATKETRYLFENLKEIAPEALIYGVHDTLGYGVGWRADNRRSDVSDVLGDLPALFGWDAFEITHYQTGDSLRDRIERSYGLGGVQTMCWHAYDPLDETFYAKEIDRQAYGDQSVVSTMLPGGKFHGTYLERLDRLAAFFKSIRGPKGESIPLIFRPWHEHNGFWFWWGKPHVSKDDYNALWRLTVEYLRDEKNVHNLIYAFSPDAGQYKKPADYFEIYPGDEYVDLLGLDAYWYNEPRADIAYLSEKIRSLAKAAMKKSKPIALTETGDRMAYQINGEQLINRHWYSNLLEVALSDELTKQLAFAMTWRNDNPKHHFNPYPGHPAVPDFKKFYQHPYTLFLENLTDLYQQPTNP